MRFNLHTVYCIVTALKIHVNPATKELLDEFGTFVLKYRGGIEMKVTLLCICNHNLFHMKVVALVLSQLGLKFWLLRFCSRTWSQCDKTENTLTI